MPIIGQSGTSLDNSFISVKKAENSGIVNIFSRICYNLWYLRRKPRGGKMVWQLQNSHLRHVAKRVRSMKNQYGKLDSDPEG